MAQKRMTDKQWKDEAIRLADKTVQVTLEEAAKYPGFIGRVLVSVLKFRGWHAFNIEGVKTFFVLKTKVS